MTLKTHAKKLMDLPFIPGSAVKDGRYRGRDRLFEIQLMSDFYPAEELVVREKVHQLKIFSVIHTDNSGKIKISLIEKSREVKYLPSVNVEGFFDERNFYL